MGLIESSVNRRITTVMVYLLIVVLGVVAMFKIPLEFMPKMDIPVIEIHVPYEGASPVEVCDRIVEPIEEAVATLPGIKKMHSRCRMGYAYVNMELVNTEKIDYMVLDVQERIDQIRKDLPSDIRQIMIMKFDTEAFPVLFGALTFPEDKAENNELIDRLVVRPLRTVDGVANVQMEGMQERRVLVEIDENKLTAYGVNVLQIFDALITANITTSAGTVDFANLKHSVRIVGEFRDLDEIRRLPVSGNIHVGDVADVHVDYVKPFFIGRLNQQRAYMLMVLKESGANTVEVCTNVQLRLAEMAANPKLAGMKLKVWFDQSREITTTMSILRGSGVEGSILAFIILLVFLKNLRSTLVVCLAIPLSALATVAVMYFVKLSFNVITLSALILSVGMLVDNAIVVLEAIDIRHRRGEKPLSAAINGTKDVGLAISVSTSTTVIVFLPLIFTEQSTSAILMKQLGLVLAISITASLVVSLTVIPLFASQFFREQPSALPRWYQYFSNWFMRLLELSLQHRARAFGIVFGIFALSIAILLWPWPRLIEKEAVPAALMRAVPITLKFEKKPSLAEMDAKIRTLEELFMAKKTEWDLDTVAAFVSDIFARVFLILPDDRMGKYTAAEIQDKAQALVKENIKWPGVVIDTKGEEMQGPGGGMGQATSLKVRGPDPDQVYAFAEDIRGRLESVPGLKEIKPIERTTEEELHVMVDRDLARQYGFQTSQVSMAVSYAIRGTPVGQMHTGESPLDIYIQVKDADAKTIPELQTMMLQNTNGQYVPLNNIARFRLIPIPELVRRDNRLITARIPIVPKGRDLGVVRDNITRELRNYHLPMGYSWVVGEEFEEQSDSLRTLAKALILAMILVFLIMTAQFESFFLPFVIMFELPFALIGVVFGLLIGRATFNVLSGAGCLLLIGIVVNNAIVLVDHVHNLRKQGVAPRDSLIEGSRDRLRPIMMTALTTIVGALPMALGMNDTGRMMYSPLAIAVVGGMAASTFLTPFMIPLIFSITDDVLARLRAAWRSATAGGIITHPGPGPALPPDPKIDADP
jgi:hydrophobic/amphiphilic exporter-1 (mainly G- bacteria), HAE1 family